MRHSARTRVSIQQPRQTPQTKERRSTPNTSLRSATSSTSLSIGVTRVRLARWSTQETYTIHQIAPEAAARARAAMPCLMKWNKSNHAIYREIAIPLLIEAVKEARGTLTPQTAQTAKQFILSGLRDADVGVRSATVIALDRFGGTDMIPALEEVAAKDPAPEVEGHSIRKSAAEAIAEIQKRESQR